MKKKYLDGESLSIRDVAEIARNPYVYEVILSKKAEAKIQLCRGEVEKMVNRGIAAYGVTTGFGSNNDKVISKKEAEKRDHQD